MIDSILWYLVLLLVGFLAFPLAYTLLPNLPDRGYSLSRPLGLLLWGFVFWLLTSLQVLQNDLGGVLFALVLLVVAGVVVLRGGKHRELLAFLRENKSTILVGEGLFLLAFIVITLMRATGPDISGTEKPMELAFINAILRSPSFPPNDPWLAGYSISYYYFGYVMVAMLSRLSGVASSVAFNLAISSWFAMTALGAYGIVFNLLSGRRKSGGEAGSAPQPKNQFWALLAPLFVLLVSNLEGFLEMLHARGLFWSQSADGSWTSRFWTWLGIQELTQPPTPPFGWVPERTAGIWWWRASRVLQDFDAMGNGKEIIDEFPFFSFLLADLHPHVLSMPFVLLAIGLALNLYLTKKDGLFEGLGVIQWLTSAGRDWRERFSEIFLLKWLREPIFWFAALVFGGLSFLNTWDFPIYVGLFVLVIVFKRFERYGWSFQRIFDLLEFGFVLGVLGVLLYFPFYVGFASQAGGFLPSIHFFTRGVHFWIMFGPFLFPMFVWLVWTVLRGGDHRPFWNGLKISGAIVFGVWLLSYLFGWLGVITPVIGNLLTSTSGDAGGLGRSLNEFGGFFASLQGGTGSDGLLWTSLIRRISQPGTWLTLLGLLALVMGLLFKDRKVEEETAQVQSSFNSRDPFVLLLILVGLGLVLVPEFIYLRDQFGWRMNTIFKFYFEAWILWGLAAAFATAVLWQKLRVRGSTVFGFFSSLLILMSLAYPIFGFRMKFGRLGEEDFQFSQLSLDGAGYLGRFYPDEMLAIEWLQTAPVGNLVEAVGGSYSGYARAATFSGMPNLLGWPGHESQWRGGAEEMGSRESDIRRLYETADWAEAMQILSQYEVRYVYVGSLERNGYRVNEVKFENRLTPVFQNGSVVIYEVPEAYRMADLNSELWEMP